MGNLDVGIADVSFEAEAFLYCLGRVLVSRYAGFAGSPVYVMMKLTIACSLPFGCALQHNSYRLERNVNTISAPSSVSFGIAVEWSAGRRRQAPAPFMCRP